MLLQCLLGPDVTVTNAVLVAAAQAAGTFVGGAERPLVALPFNRSTPIVFYNRTLFAELEQLERDILTHVHLENHVLMPRFAKA